MGLTRAGKFLLHKAMQYGMVMESDHFSEKAFHDTYRLAADLRGSGRKNPYPLVSSHTAFRAQGNGYPVLKVTASKGYSALSNEIQKSDDMVAKIKRTGGMVAPILTQGRVKAYRGRWGQVANDCDASSKSYAQSLLYTLNITEGAKEKIRGTKNVGKSRPCIFEIRNKKVLKDFDKVMQFKIKAK